MNDRTIVVATFAQIQEARMAAHLLIAENIPAILEGEEIGNVLSGLPIGDQIRLLVPELDAPRASGLVAEAQSGTLADDWEDEAERVPVCTICGEALVEADARCPACHSPRDGIRVKPASPTGLKPC